MKQIYKFLILSLTNIFVVLNVYSQIITVINDKNKRPVDNVFLFNSSRNISVLTDSDGKANITNFAENDSIFFQHPSFIQAVYLKRELLSENYVTLTYRVLEFDEFIITASRTSELKKYLPQMIDVIDNVSLFRNTGMTSADILTNTGNVFIQKTQGGGGSPVLRGLEANKILLVVDGIRMNNAIYRSGHLQNSITIDNAILNRVEVIYGPNSMIYGSDALGGVIHYITKDPEFSKSNDPGININANAYVRYSSAMSGKTAHLDINTAKKNIGMLTSITLKSFDDILMGKNKNPFYDDFGEIKHFVKRINGQDSTVTNPNPFLQKNTDYSQIDFLQKVRFKLSGQTEMTANIQYSTSSDIDRLDFLNDYKGSNLKYSEYYYGPQNRLFASLKASFKNEGFLYSEMNSIIAYQKIDEDRYSRKFRNDDLFVQKEDVDVFSFNHDLRKEWNERNTLNYGLELIYNQVSSAGFYENISNHAITPAETRYPDGGTKAWTSAAYGNYKWSRNLKYIFSAGLRYQYASYSSRFKSGILPYDKININNGALTGSVSMVYNPGANWKLSSIASTGFRIPNVDDYGKVRAKNELVTVPNPGLSPEYTYNFELAAGKTVTGLLSFNISAYYTLLTDAIVRSEFTLNGSDSLEYDNEMYKIITNINANKAYIRGVAFYLASELNSPFGFMSTLNLTEGRDISDHIPMAHIPPLFGRTSMTYNKKSFYCELFSNYNGWKKIKDFSPLGEDNETEATIHGSPSWFTLNINTVYNIKDYLSIQFAIENILDTFYKPFASGVSAPGRNFIVTIRGRI